MKILNQWIYKHSNGSYHTLYMCENGEWFTTDNGAFGQRDMTIVRISGLMADQIIAGITEQYKNEQK